MSPDWTEYHGVWLCPSLQEGGETRAITNLQRYFQRTSKGERFFTGGAWDTFDPGGTRDCSANVFTADDVLSCTLLSTPIGAPAAIALLDPVVSEGFSILLSQIPTDRDFVDEASRDSDSFRPAVDLYNELFKLRGVGLTRATKLLARKRPRLVPIIDSVILRDVLHGSKTHWQPLLTAFQAGDRALWNRLVELHSTAGLSADVTVLRVFDVLSWMEGAGHADQIMSGAEITAPDDGVQDDPDGL